MTASVEFRRYNSRRRRVVHLQKRILLMAFTLIFISTGIILGSSFSAAAKNTGASLPAFKYYTSIQVKAGDSLWSIASEYAVPEYYGSYDEYIKEVMNMNHLKEETIHATQYLTIPYYSHEYK